MYNSSITLKQKHQLRAHSARISFFLLISFLFFFNVNIKAQGNLLITPYRVIFEGQKRLMEINLANVGQDSAKYSISFLQYRMTEDGAFEEITTPGTGQNFADKNIRFFPRSVMLAPNESQVIKLQLIKSDQLGPGEYRSHLYFRSLPNQKALGVEDTKIDTTVLTIKIVPVFGITIPVIIRVGESTTTINIDNIKLETAADGTNKLLLAIHRTGNMSVYGDISISHIATNGKETKIGLLKGVVVYTPNLLRRLKVDLENKSSVDLSKGTIRILFSTESDTRPQKLAEAELTL
jgi:hypothetical protein